ncbi:MAG: dihydropyrimidinase [Spirochaetes bacterium]|nr:dihydropyrimidinase [Spirochaetota bacterium]
MALLIKGGTIVTSSEEFRGDILVRGEKIAAVGSGLDWKEEQTIDAAGKYVFPGGIDGHTHFGLSIRGARTASFDTTPAAVSGGTTTIIDFVPQPKGMSLLDASIKHRSEMVEGVSAADFGLHAMVMDAQPGIYDELPALVEAGIPTIKLLMAYKGTPFYSDDATIFKMLEATKKVGMLTMLHAENGDIIDVLEKRLISEGNTDPKYHAESRPPAAEIEATFRAVMLAQAADAPVFVVHVSCADAMAAVRDARGRGIAAFGETCPPYLTLDVGYLTKSHFEGAKYVCSPPLREKQNQQPLWQALQNGWLQTVGTDHCGLNFKGQKDMGRGDFTKIPSGFPGVENRLALLYSYGVRTGKLSLQRMVDVFATVPAKLFGLYRRKGSVTVGKDAGLVISDPDYRGKISAKTSLHGVDYNAYENFDQIGRVDKVFLRGKLSVHGGKFTGCLGQGRYMERETYTTAYTGGAKKRLHR